ncbi:putative ribonuclease H protein [Glycine soja]
MYILIATIRKWKQRCLSMGGRISLVNSILTALPIYLLSFFKIPKKVVHKVVSIQRKLLWGGGSKAAKIAWVNWDSVCLSKNKGGLGIKDLSNFNEAFLAKWGWELANNQNQLWARVLLSKYGGWNALCYGRDSAHFSHWAIFLRTRGYGLVVEGQGVPTTSGAAMGQLVDHNFAFTPSTVLYIILLISAVQKKKHTRTKNAIQEIEAATRFLEHTTKIHIHPHSVHCWKRRVERNGYTTRSAYLLMQGEATEENSDQNLMDT